MANHDLIAVDSWDTQQSPTNGDTNDAAYDEACHQDSANRTEYLRQRMITQWGDGAAQFRYLDTPVSSLSNAAFTDYWQIYPGGGANQIWTANVSYLDYSLSGCIPNGAVLTSVSAWLQGNPVHAGAVGTPPVLTIYVIDPTNGTIVLSQNIADAAAGVPATYDVTHLVQLVLAPTITVSYGSYNYTVEVSGEDGLNARSNLKCYGVGITYTSPVT